MELSNRLKAVADMITPGMVVADLGTDHGYIPIYLVEEKICTKVYAMDINQGPYEKAKQHIAAYGLSKIIETRLSDGMKALEVGEATAIVIAGMGGGLVIKILDQDQRLWDGLEEMILQPQSEIHKVREYLQLNNFTIKEEEMIYEDGKYYPILRVIKGKRAAYSLGELYYGPFLIEKKHPVLKEFIQKEIQQKESIIQKIQLQQKQLVEASEHLKLEALEVRIKELKKEMELAYEVFGNL